MKHIIQDVMMNYEKLLVKINDKWIFFDINKLKGIAVEGNIITKRTRVWLV